MCNVGLGLARLLLIAGPVMSADFGTYRGFAFGSNVETAAKQAGAKMLNVRTVHRRPALIEELDWESGAYSQAESVRFGPVREGLLRFYNGQLFQIVVTYDRQRTEGMTTADMIDGISSTYGAATKPNVEIGMKSIYGEVARVLARWDSGAYIYDLVRTGDQTSYALILRSKHLSGLAEAAMAESERLDISEAPGRADALQKRQDNEARSALEKARQANKPAFKP